MCTTAQLHNCTMCTTALASAALMWSHFAGSSDGNSTQHCDILTGELSDQRMCSSRRFFWRISQVAAVGFRREAVGAKNMKSLTIMRGFHRWQWQTCQWPQASGNCGFCGRWKHDPSMTICAIVWLSTKQQILIFCLCGQLSQHNDPYLSQKNT